MRNIRVLKNIVIALFCHVILLAGMACGVPAAAEAAGEQSGEPVHLEGFDLEVKEIAIQCADDVTKGFDALLESKRLTSSQLFDTFYIPIPNTSPQKYHTQYDTITEDLLLKILDSYLEKDKRFLYVVAVDKNGYVPTHNSQYTQPLTNNLEYNTKNNRTKRLFNDRTGSRAAKNVRPYFLQTYSRDTGETLYDMSVPILINDKHWGGIRIGYQK